MRILIVGADGQLGHALQGVATSHELIPLTYAELDITDLGAVREAVAAYRPAALINCAAYTNVDGAETDPVAAYRVNAVGPRNLAIAASAHDLPLVHVSTDYVFDGRAERPYHEYDSPHPLSIYGQSKLAGEEAVASLHARHYIARTAWLYHTLPAEGKNFPRTMLGLAGREEVRVVSDQYGSPTYAPHLAQALLTLLETEAYGTYHLAGRGGTSWFELTRRLYDLFQIQTRVTPVATAEFPRPAPRPRYSVMTTIQSPEILLPPWEEGLAAFHSAMKKAS